jgi:integrative and conjugative element protein (TIGR02256 family)
MSLETRILKAIERGDTAEVERLRAQYRRSGITRYGGTCEVVGRSRFSQERPRVSKPAKPRPAPYPVPELRADATPTLTVRLGVGALNGISAELERSDGLLHTVETGGNLFGRHRGKTIELVHASGPGDDGEARRFENSVMVSLADGYRHAEELERIYQRDVSFLGGWHTHPIRQPLPSATDRSEGLAGLDQMHRLGTWATCWLDLILMPDVQRGWDAPSIRGWATVAPTGEPLPNPFGWWSSCHACALSRKSDGHQATRSMPSRASARGAAGWRRGRLLPAVTRW